MKKQDVESLLQGNVVVDIENKQKILDGRDNFSEDQKNQIITMIQMMGDVQGDLVHLSATNNPGHADQLSLLTQAHLTKTIRGMGDDAQSQADKLLTSLDS